MMTDEQQSFWDSHRTLAQVVRKSERFALDLPLVGRIGVPRPEQVAFFLGLGALVALELIEWPVALALGAGQVLISEQMSRSHPPAAGEQPA
jgi:hypothetical protein